MQKQSDVDEIANQPVDERPSTTPSPTFDTIFAVMAAISGGDADARVVIPDDGKTDDLATKFAIALNSTLDYMTSRVAQIEADHRITQMEFERRMAERTEQLQQTEAIFSKAFQASPA